MTTPLHDVQSSVPDKNKKSASKQFFKKLSRSLPVLKCPWQLITG